MRKTIIIPLLIVTLLLIGCEQFEQRFMEEGADERILSSEALANPAHRGRPMTVSDDILVPSGGKTKARVGFFNQLQQMDIFVSGEEEATKYDRGEKHTMMCKGKNNYDYTLKVISPVASVAAFESIGIEVEVVDEHGLAPGQMTCTMTVVNAQSNFVQERIEIDVMIMES